MTDVKTTSTDATSTAAGASAAAPLPAGPLPDDSFGANSVLTYQRMRSGLMILAFLLPPVLYLWGLVSSGTWPPSWPQSSMSYYYYYGGPWGPRGVFVGVLWAIGVFLLLYKPEGNCKTLNLTEDGWLKVAGFAALLIALAPMNPEGDCKKDFSLSIQTFHGIAAAGFFEDLSLYIHKVHGFAAAGFFIAICTVCVFYPPNKTKKRGLEVGSWICAGIMALTIALAFGYYVLAERFLGIEGKQFLCDWSFVFGAESVAVYTFATYWCLKNVDEKEQLQRLVKAGVLTNKSLQKLPGWVQAWWWEAADKKTK